ncbi:DUF6882 domain-containing protein [Cryobacterium mannosilyticum]|uniref:Uncharacterized protein n=1 Tax=Cryobacterium mannosilyticum TaxID=1259190 RepID=A0A4R8WG05_9MICO|nr:DUF6882 domain-containing protein [Cryobacterium mannosilyticum]TFC07985.1 hypothetical protein E3O32_00545 [Cryobacterium mannosilyticum]
MTPELAQLIVESHVEVLTKQARAAEQWGIGSADRWSADLAGGTISFEFPDRVITGEVELLGSYVLSAGTWLWGWANESVPESATGASRKVRAIATRPGLELLAEAKLQMPAEVADDLANIAVGIGGLDGWYRGPSTTQYVYLGFRDFTIVAS